MAHRMGWLLASVLALSAWAGEAHASPAGLRGARVVTGQAVPDGDLLEAGDGGLTLELSYGSRVTLAAGSRFRFLKVMKLPIGSPQHPMIPASVMRLEVGRIDAELQAPNHYALLVLGPRKLRVIVKGGRASVLARMESVVAVSRSGVGLVSLGKKWRRLPAGQTHVVSKRYPAGVRHAVLSAPSTPTLSRRMILAGGGQADSTAVSWSTVDRAAYYELRVETPAGGLVHAERVQSSPTALAGIPAGHYQLTVQAIDDAGIAGAVSEPAELHVVGLNIPKTASRGREGQVRLQPGQRVGLVGVEGLQVGYLGLDGFLPAPTSVGLVARRPISMLLRHPETHESVGLSLEPMTVHAEIAFEKHPDAWPAEGVPVTVTLVDSDGYAVPDWFEVECDVTVNLKSASPHWTRRGGRLETRLDHPPGSSGPWIIRVDVLDERGASLGRDLAEIAYEGAY